ncbi:unnamed protein product [Paramecium pentaurelia]|uniref:Uncharacterized protein n=1 Tax=Paramecium pentaurelia TaxID=43138 RepID=A0A8S1SYD1_9CILI|nr:unnamed protein product [Paramecium pentaurelia]
MEERQSSVKGLRDYFQGIAENLKQQNDNYLIIKQNSTSVPPQRNSINRDSIKMNVQKMESFKGNKGDDENYLKIINQLKEKIKYYEQSQDNNEYQKLQERFNDQKMQLQLLQQMNDQLNEEIIIANNTIANLENQIQKQEHQTHNLNNTQKNLTQKLKIEQIDKEIQVDLISPLIEQNKLLLERLHENPEPKGKELIIINSSQAIELRRQMETLKQELCERLNQYNNLIQNKQLSEIKKSIKIDINQFHDTYIQMFRNINRPIQNVEQVSKILSPIYQDELNEFLGQLSDFLDKFRLVSIL